MGEKTGEVLGEKIHEKFSSKRKKEPPMNTPEPTKPTEPMGELGRDEMVKILQEVTKKRGKEDRKKERKTLNDAFVAEFL